MCTRIVSLALALALSLPLVAQEAGSYDKWILQLTSPRFSERERAFHELEQAGLPALEALRRAAKVGDAETARRAGELVRKLEEQQATAQILTPKKLRLNVKDATLEQAVAELSRVSGYEIQASTRSDSPNSITLDTGETTFWEALDRLSKAAGLTVKHTKHIPAAQPGLDRPAVPLNRAVPLPRPAPIPVPNQLNVVPMPEPVPQAKGVDKAPAVKLIERAAEPAKVEVLPAAGPGVLIIPVQLPAQPAPPVQPGGIPIQAQPVPIQAQPMPIQIQVQPGGIQIQFQPALPIQPLPIAPNGGLIGAAVGGVGNEPTQKILMAPGRNEAERVCYAGAVRVVVRPAPAKEKGQLNFVLEAFAEPRLQNFTLLGVPVIKRALDDQGQHLSPVMRDSDPAGAPSNAPTTEVAFQVKAGEKPAKALKDLTGTLSATAMLHDQLLFEMNDVLNSAGKSVESKAGGTFKLLRIEKQDNGEVVVEFSLDNVPRARVPIVIQQGAGVVQGGFRIVTRATDFTPDLSDAKGRKYQVSQVQRRMMRTVNGQSSTTGTFVYRAVGDAGEPSRISMTGVRTIAVPIDFRFEDVPTQP